MLATPVEALPSGSGWRYEFKWDGVRALVEVNAGVVRIRSRRGNEVTIAYPELAGWAPASTMRSLMARSSRSIAADRRSVFCKPACMSGPRPGDRLAATTPVTFVAFDLLRLYGVNLTEPPASERRATLERMVADHPQWTLSPLFDDGPATEAAAGQHGLEGVVAKRDASSTESGLRIRLAEDPLPAPRRVRRRRLGGRPATAPTL